MPKRGAKPTRAPLRGWLGVVILCSIPCVLLLSEVWMNVHIIDHAYERGRLSREMRETREQIQELEKELAELENVQKMADAAPDLGLVEAEYDQIRVVRASSANDTSVEAYAANDLNGESR